MKFLPKTGGLDGEMLSGHGHRNHILGICHDYPDFLRITHLLITLFHLHDNDYQYLRV